MRLALGLITEVIKLTTYSFDFLFHYHYFLTSSGTAHDDDIHWLASAAESESHARFASFFTSGRLMRGGKRLDTVGKPCLATIRLECVADYFRHIMIYNTQRFGGWLSFRT